MTGELPCPSAMQKCAWAPLELRTLHVRIARSKQNPCCMWVAKRYPPSLACTYMYIFICICTTTHPHPQTHRTITFAHLYCCHGHEVVKTTRNQLHYLSACEQCPIRTSEQGPDLTPSNPSQPLGIAAHRLFQVSPPPPPPPLECFNMPAMVPATDAIYPES